MTRRIGACLGLLLVGLTACRTVQPPAPQAVGKLDLASVQRRLAWAGFHPPHAQETPTAVHLAEAVQRFQRFAKLPDHGVIDARTWDVLQQLYDPGKPRPLKTTMPPVVWPRSVMHLVQKSLVDLGYRLTATSGVLDAATADALHHFKEQHALADEPGVTPHTLFVLLQKRCQHGCALHLTMPPTGTASMAAPPSPTPAAERPTPVQTALAGPTLGPLLHQMLRVLMTQQGYDIPATEEPFGAATQAALRRFQGIHGLTTQGLLTPATILTLLATACGAGCELHLTVESLQQSRKRPPVQTPPCRAPVQVADQAYAIEHLECSDASGAWVRLYQGTVVDVDPRTVRLRLEERFSYRYQPQAEGVDRTDWWCIPPKRHCYVAVDFRDWNGPFPKQAIASFPAERVMHGRLGIIQSILPFVQKRCASTK